MVCEPSGHQVPSSPFSSLLGGLSCYFDDMINALIGDCGITVPCRLSFGDCGCVVCPNCQGGIYRPGGAVYFPPGKVCPVCFNRTITVENTELVDLIVNFDSRKFYILNNNGDFRTSQSSSSPNMYAETFSRIELYPKFKACDYIVLDTNTEEYGINRYRRVGEPQPIGLGNKSFLIVAWQKGA